MLIFVPSDDYSTDALLASAVSELTIGYLKATGSKQVSFRVGNIGSSLVAATLTVDDLQDPEVHEKASLSIADFSLPPGEISDTVTLTISLPLQTPSGSHVLIVASSTGETLEIYVDYVGANTERRAQTPDREGAATRVTSSVIAALGDTLTLLRFDPVPFDETDTRRMIGDMVITFPAGQAGCDPCSRLNPGHPLQQAYTQSSETIIGQFQHESRTIRQRFEAANTLLTYDVVGSLIIPSEFELTRQWALFSPESHVEPARYKRTVFFVKRQGEFYCVETLRTLDNADDLSHFECDLISLKTATMGCPDFYNPFAIVYLLDSDEPYAAYPCPCDILEQLSQDGSQSS